MGKSWKAIQEQGWCRQTSTGYNYEPEEGREEGEMRLIKEGIFWRILVANDTMISKKKFLRFQSAVNYMDMQDKHGMPVENYKKEKK